MGQEKSRALLAFHVFTGLLGSTQAWEPLWTTIPQASQSWREPLCGCKSENCVLDSENEILPNCRAQHCVIAGILWQGISSQLVAIYCTQMDLHVQLEHDILHMLEEYRKRAVTTF